jgi:hypothetical protein
MRPLLPLALALAAIATFGLSGCGDDDEIFRANPAPYEDKAGKEITSEIAGLANGGRQGDPSASVAYDNAIQSLIMRGVKAETRVIDALRADPDPHVRIGCIEVLRAIATKASIEHLIAVLDDSDPMVAWNAEITLRVMGRTRMIPEAGQPAKDGLPPVPVRKADDLAIEADERIWNTWYAAHKAELKAAWERWWADNKATFKVE